MSGDTGLLGCSSQLPITVNAGDNNGYEVDAHQACMDDGVPAQDKNSGTGAPNSCNSATKDRHVFRGFDIDLPAGSTVTGIEVNLDTWADATQSGPQICVELSWDGGLTWTNEESSDTLGDTERNLLVGSEADTWGRSWQTQELTDEAFRVRLTSKAANAGRDFFLDWVAVRVSYQTP